MRKLLLAALVLAGCGGGSQAMHYTEQQVVQRLHLQSTDVGYTSPDGCQYLVVLTTPQEIDIYRGDEWLVMNQSGTVGMKVEGGPDSCPAQAEINKLR